MKSNKVMILAAGAAAIWYFFLRGGSSLGAVSAGTSIDSTASQASAALSGNSAAAADLAVSAASTSSLTPDMVTVLNWSKPTKYYQGFTAYQTRITPAEWSMVANLITNYWNAGHTPSATQANQWVAFLKKYGMS